MIIGKFLPAIWGYMIATADAHAVASNITNVTETPRITIKENTSVIIDAVPMHSLEEPEVKAEAESGDDDVELHFLEELYDYPWYGVEGPSQHRDEDAYIYN